MSARDSSPEISRQTEEEIIQEFDKKIHDLEGLLTQIDEKISNFDPALPQTKEERRLRDERWDLTSELRNAKYDRDTYMKAVGADVESVEKVETGVESPVEPAPVEAAPPQEVAKSKTLRERFSSLGEKGQAFAKRLFDAGKSEEQKSVETHAGLLASAQVEAVVLTEFTKKINALEGGIQEIDAALASMSAKETADAKAYEEATKAAGISVAPLRAASLDVAMQGLRKKRLVLENQISEVQGERTKHLVETETVREKLGNALRGEIDMADVVLRDQENQAQKLWDNRQANEFSRASLEQQMKTLVETARTLSTGSSARLEVERVYGIAKKLYQELAQEDQKSMQELSVINKKIKEGVVHQDQARQGLKNMLPAEDWEGKELRDRAKEQEPLNAEITKRVKTGARDISFTDSEGRDVPARLELLVKDEPDVVVQILDAKGRPGPLRRVAKTALQFPVSQKGEVVEKPVTPASAEDAGVEVFLETEPVGITEADLIEEPPSVRPASPEKSRNAPPPIPGVRDADMMLADKTRTFYTIGPDGAPLIAKIVDARPGKGRVVVAYEVKGVPHETTLDKVAFTRDQDKLREKLVAETSKEDRALAEWQQSPGRLVLVGPEGRYHIKLPAEIEKGDEVAVTITTGINAGKVKHFNKERLLTLLEEGTSPEGTMEMLAADAELSREIAAGESFFLPPTVAGGEPRQVQVLDVLVGQDRVLVASWKDGKPATSFIDKKHFLGYQPALRKESAEERLVQAVSPEEKKERAEVKGEIIKAFAEHKQVLKKAEEEKRAGVWSLDTEKVARPSTPEEVRTMRNQMLRAVEQGIEKHLRGASASPQEAKLLKEVLAELVGPDGLKDREVESIVKKIEIVSGQMVEKMRKEAIVQDELEEDLSQAAAAAPKRPSTPPPPPPVPKLKSTPAPDAQPPSVPDLLPPAPKVKPPPLPPPKPKTPPAPKAPDTTPPPPDATKLPDVVSPPPAPDVKAATAISLRYAEELLQRAPKKSNTSQLPPASEKVRASLKSAKELLAEAEGLRGMKSLSTEAEAAQKAEKRKAAIEAFDKKQREVAVKLPDIGPEPFSHIDVTPEDRRKSKAVVEQGIRLLVTEKLGPIFEAAKTPKLNKTAARAQIETAMLRILENLRGNQDQMDAAILELQKLNEAQQVGDRPWSSKKAYKDFEKSLREKK